jgi:hypothetical protein
MSTQCSQQDYLRAAKEALDVDWDTLAVRAGIAPRAMKNYRLPSTSEGYRELPALARAALEALLEEAGSSPHLSQQAYLRNAKKTLGLTWDALAAAAGVSPRALKNWRMPDASANLLSMPAVARRAIDKLLLKGKQPAP